MTVPVLSHAYAQTLLAGTAGSWLTPGLSVLLHDAGYVFDPAVAAAVPPANILAEVPLTGLAIINGWAVAAPALVTSYATPRVTSGVLLCATVSSAKIPRIKLPGLTPGFVPAILPFWLVWQGEGIFRP